VMILNVITFIVALVLRKKYLPLRAKNLPLVGLVIFGSFNTYIGYILGPMHILNPVLPESVKRAYFNPIFGIMVHCNLGAFVWLLAFVLRHRLLYQVLIQRGQFTLFRSIVWPALLLYSPNLIYNATILIFFRDKAYVWNDQIHAYTMKFGASIASFAIAAVYILMIFYYNYRLRSIAAIFNEFHVTFWAMIFFAVYFVMNFLYLAVPKYANIIVYVNFFWILLFSQFWFFFIMLINVYRYFFNHDSYLKEFMNSSDMMTYVRAISQEDMYDEDDVELNAVLQPSEIL